MSNAGYIPTQGMRLPWHDEGHEVLNDDGETVGLDNHKAGIVKCVNRYDELVRENEIMREALEIVADCDDGTTAGLAFTAKEALKKAGAL